MNGCRVQNAFVWTIRSVIRLSFASGGVSSMPMNFHDEKNRNSYVSRQADETWLRKMRDLADPNGLRVADIGCGRGIYSRAWVEH
jgi:ubiquinone/menaquinone biosynthesis C-methylase UbiE